MNLSFGPQGDLAQAEAEGGDLHGLHVDISAIGGRGQRVQQGQGGWLQENHIQAVEEAAQGHLWGGRRRRAVLGADQPRAAALPLGDLCDPHFSTGPSAHSKHLHMHSVCGTLEPLCGPQGGNCCTELCGL